MLDLGTGSGCIAIALAAAVPGVEVMAADISPVALAVARRNAERLLPASPITFVEADLFPGREKFHLVTANLPYIPTSTLTRLPVVTHEPVLALDGGEDGLAVIRRLLKAAPAHLLEGGCLLLEIEISQGSAVMSLAKESFPEAEVQLHPDLTGRDRLVEILLPPGRQAP